jgi:hypothetical protein
MVPSVRATPVGVRKQPFRPAGAAPPPAPRHRPPAGSPGRRPSTSRPPAASTVLDGSRVQPALARWDAGDVRQPGRIGGLWVELPVQEVVGHRRAMVGVGGAAERARRLGPDAVSAWLRFSAAAVPAAGPARRGRVDRRSITAPPARIAPSFFRISRSARSRWFSARRRRNSSSNGGSLPWPGKACPLWARRACFQERSRVARMPRERAASATA